MSAQRISVRGFSVPLTTSSPAAHRANPEGNSVDHTRSHQAPPSTGPAHVSIGGFRIGNDTHSTQHPTSASQSPRLRVVPGAAEAAPEPPTPWHYWVQYADSHGSGGCEIRRAKQITNHGDIEHIGQLITAKTGRPPTITTYSLLNSPPSARTPRSRTGRPTTRASDDPAPWHYWVAFLFLTGPAGGGACEVRRTHKIRSGDDMDSLNELITQQIGRPVRVSAHTLLSGPDHAFGGAR
jgi:hypothetical protein